LVGKKEEDIPYQICKPLKKTSDGKKDLYINITCHLKLNLFPPTEKN